MRRAAARDRNQPEIVTALRRVGASVALTYRLGSGFPDLAIGFRGLNLFAEVKDGDAPPSQQRLTEDEQHFHDSWCGQIAVVRTIDEALRLLGLR